MSFESAQRAFESQEAPEYYEDEITERCDNCGEPNEITIDIRYISKSFVCDNCGKKMNGDKAT